jgi:hypothetical protein
MNKKQRQEIIINILPPNVKLLNHEYGEKVELIHDENTNRTSSIGLYSLKDDDDYELAKDMIKSRTLVSLGQLLKKT